MNLTTKQLQTLVDLKKRGLCAEPEDVVAWCQQKLKQSSRKGSGRKDRRIGRRKHGRQHYQEIIIFMGGEEGCRWTG